MRSFIIDISGQWQKNKNKNKLIAETLFSEYFTTLFSLKLKHASLRCAQV